MCLLVTLIIFFPPLLVLDSLSTFNTQHLLRKLRTDTDNVSIGDILVLMGCHNRAFFVVAIVRCNVSVS
jgi:hypothetical protein